MIYNCIYICSPTIIFHLKHGQACHEFIDEKCPVFHFVQNLVGAYIASMAQLLIVSRLSDVESVPTNRGSVSRAGTDWV